MSLAPTQNINREELDILNRALDCFYKSDSDLTDEEKEILILLKEKIKQVRFSNFQLCQLETF